MTTYQLYLLLLGYLTELKCDNKDVINTLLELYKRAEKESNKTKLYFDDREICKFTCSGACSNMNIPLVVNCDGYNKNCHYRDMEKKTLSEAIVKESEA